MSSLSFFQVVSAILLFLAVMALPTRGIASTRPADPAGVASYFSRLGDSTDAGERITSLSTAFLGMPYEPATLIGGPDVPERLVVKLDSFDCMTFLETIEALRRSEDFKQFTPNLVKVRYFHADIAYESRRHFFSDWLIDSGGYLEDVTSIVAPEQSEIVTKMLNRKGSDGLWLPDIPVTSRQIRYVPGERIDHDVLGRLRTGDFIGIFSLRKGLDVSHVGIAIRSENGLFFRHASSSKDVRKVTDVPLAGYLAERPGMIVFRALDP